MEAQAVKIKYFRYYFMDWISDNTEYEINDLVKFFCCYDDCWTKKDAFIFKGIIINSLQTIFFQHLAEHAQKIMKIN